ncbi:hypothetical protein [Spirosoma pollinicola]|uniref:hypothetical protein n=1 Tax=Spirosoma pollinicola TaxID=2057025 RepID=UPI001F0BD3A5|nr:hypothetical protein [Spirosoma pollinicola]
MRKQPVNGLTQQVHGRTAQIALGQWVEHRQPQIGRRCAGVVDGLPDEYSVRQGGQETL